jgi:accessory gene regulator protein AgrB
MGFIPITYSFYSILAMTILMPYFSQNIFKISPNFLYWISVRRICRLAIFAFASSDVASIKCYG